MLNINNTSLQDILTRFSVNYPEGLVGIDQEHDYYKLLVNNAPKAFYSTRVVDDITYKVEGSVGDGKLSCVTWIAIFDQHVTMSAQEGQYIVYLRAKNGDIYLTFNQGCAEIAKKYKKTSDELKALENEAKRIRQKIKSSEFSVEAIDLQYPKHKKAKEYQAGTIYSKKYSAGEIPDEKELINDLQKMLELYKQFVSAFPRKIKSWLLTYDPNGSLYDYDSYRDALNRGENFSESWLCKNTHPLLGDRVYMMRTSSDEKNGIIASGYVTRVSYKAPHYSQPNNQNGKKYNYIDFQYDFMIDMHSSSFLAQKILISKFPDQDWSPKGSGIEILRKYSKLVEDAWESCITDLAENKESMNRGIIENIKNYISSEGFYYPEGMIENFYLCIKSKPFVILAGTSGTGKTKLVRLFAEAIGAENEYRLIPVRPDWSDSSDLFGYTDLNGNFIPGIILQCAKEANKDRKKPYIICLDEMNLARVEYYFSDLLSVMETRCMNGHELSSKQPIVSEDYFRKNEEAIKEYGNLYYPENLYIIGTVNMDETTFPFSKKVLDRANTIEFDYVDFTIGERVPASKPNHITNSFLKSNYLTLNQCEDIELVEKISKELQEINTILKRGNCHFGYRVRDEIVYYLMNNREAGMLISEDEALDNEIMQKILPRIQGSSTAIKTMLCDLFKHFFKEFDYQPLDNDIYEKMENILKNGNIKYAKSLTKIAFMIRRYEEDGFTSYWL